MILIEHLKKRKDFIKIAHSKKKSIAKGLIIQASPRKLIEKKFFIRVGFTITKKVGNAVVRNRIRRRLRSIFKQLIIQMGMPGWDYVIIARKAIINYSFNQIINDMKFVISNIHNCR